MAGGRRTAIDYRSKQVWGQLPVVHISVGGRQADGRYRLGRARGIIALDDVAIGLVAVGRVAIGLLSVGGVALGLIAVGAVAIGLAAVGVATAALVAGPPPAAKRRLGGTWRVEGGGSAESGSRFGQPIQNGQLATAAMPLILAVAVP